MQSGSNIDSIETASEEAVLEEILVTGSRIKRKDIDGVGKVNILSAEDFAKIGAVSIDQLLKYSPFTAGAQAGAESNYLSTPSLRIKSAEIGVLPNRFDCDQLFRLRLERRIFVSSTQRS